MQAISKRFKNLSTPMKIYLVIISLVALAQGLGNNVLSNYFKDAYNVSAYLRGVIEFPRELPGLLCIFVVAALSFLGDVRIAIFAQVLAIAGITVLGFVTPEFSIMLIFIFINSMGIHLFMPLQDSIGLSLVDKGKLGTRMGQFKGLVTGFSMLAAILVFIGFRVGFFSFKTEIKGIFLISASFSLIALILLIVLYLIVKKPVINKRQVKFLFRKEYKYYYILVILFGVQKQIMLVYGPWVLIDLLSKQADTLAILTIIGSFIGIFFIPALGRWMDRFGIKIMLYADALSFIGVYLLYGVLSGGYANGSLPTAGLSVFFAYGLFIIDRMSTQMGLIRTVYLRTIAIKNEDITPTLSMGLSLDHAVSITCAYLGGILWSKMGPQYVFFMAAGFSLINLYVAIKVKIPKKQEV